MCPLHDEWVELELSQEYSASISVALDKSLARSWTGFCFVYLYGEDFSLDSSYLPLFTIVGFLTHWVFCAVDFSIHEGVINSFCRIPFDPLMT